MQTNITIVQGAGEIGSAVAHALFRSGHAVVIHEPCAPFTTRRRMSFADAVFDGVARLEGVSALTITDAATLPAVLDAHAEIPIVSGDLRQLLDALQPQVLVDARMRKRSTPESQRRLAPLTIGLGPNFVAGDTVHLVVETSWDCLGKIIRRGASLPLSGEPRNLAGYGRERFVYAPIAGLFRTAFDIGAPVGQGAAIAAIESTPLYAPLTGILRGITRANVRVPAGTKVVEVDPRGDPTSAIGIGERPRKIAQAVLQILNDKPAATSDHAAPRLPASL